MMKLAFPESGEDLAAAFNNAISEGVMQRENEKNNTNFWPRFEFLGSDVEGDEIVADWFFNSLSGLYVRVKRAGVME